MSRYTDDEARRLAEANALADLAAERARESGDQGLSADAKAGTGEKEAGRG